MVAHRCSDDLELAKENLPKIGLRRKTRRRAACEQAAPTACRAQAADPGVCADVIDDNIDAALVRQVTDFPVELLRLVIDEEVRAKLSRSLELFIAAGRRENPATHHLRNLNRGRSNAGSGTEDQHILTRTDVSFVDHHAPRRQKDEWGGRSVFTRK